MMITLRTLITTLLLAGATAPLAAQADLGDLEMAHVAVTASDIDIAYAHLALALSENAAVRRFAQTMILDHTAVNEQVAALAKKLDVEAKDNGMSQQLLADARRTKDGLSRLRGEEFDRAYAENELAYHRTVNGVVADAFIPNVENDQVKKAFQDALTIFRGHERHAEQMVSQVGSMRR
jgi:putative membrane protein